MPVGFSDTLVDLDSNDVTNIKGNMKRLIEKQLRPKTYFYEGQEEFENDLKESVHLLRKEIAEIKALLSERSSILLTGQKAIDEFDKLKGE